jgi:hypothetical protein
MNLAASFSLVKNQGISIGRRADNATEGDADWLSDSFGQFIYGSKLCFASCNVEPAHTQASTLFPTCDEVISLIGLLETKVMSVSSGKQ